jgi:3D (Asp-Asp-Asp) domain-containing protein
VRARPTALAALVLAAAITAPGCALLRQSAPPAHPPAAARELVVTATAYNSVRDQTEGDPWVTASGERLAPGNRVIAVSHDLYRAGLVFGTRVWIDGMPGEWRVADRMAPRWRRKIDLYFGVDEAGARRFGKRQLRIRWQAPR